MLKGTKGFEGFEESHKKTAMAFIEANQNCIAQLSLRSLAQTLDLIKSDPDKWNDLALYTLTQ